jgi:hypothetical protein
LTRAIRSGRPYVDAARVTATVPRTARVVAVALVVIVTIDPRRTNARETSIVVLVVVASSNDVIDDGAGARFSSMARLCVIDGCLDSTIRRYMTQMGLRAFQYATVVQRTSDARRPRARA